MKTNFFSANAGLDDLVFENRNKMYGAYDLRKTYEERLTLSTMGTVSFFMLLLAALYYLQPSPAIPDIIIPKDPLGKTITLVDPPLIELPPRMFNEPAASGTIVVPKITKEKVNDDKLPPKNDEVKGNTTGDGKVTDGTGTDPNAVKPIVSGPSTTITEAPVIKEFITFYDKGPEFQGGLSAYENFLQSHINYPEYAITNNIQGTIFLMVKIDEKGKIVGVEVVKGIGGGCDEEAARVIKSMPDWKPAQQNGKPVPVKCVLRVKMLLQN